MRLDEWLLDHVEEPTLRFYGWSRPCLSLGYAQSDAWLDRPGLAELGVEVVRRPSGGQAVLHQGEITYAAVLPQASRSGLRAAFAEVSGWFVEALQTLGWPVESGAGHRAGRSKALPHSCYDGTMGGEVTYNGSKLIGSAGLRRGPRWLQHGSIPVTPDLELFRRMFPGAALPAALPGLTVAQLVEAFPRPLLRRDWSEAERRRLCLS